MKNIIFKILVLSFVLSMNAKAQSPNNSAINKEKMTAFASWAGIWEGEGSMQMGPGSGKKTSVREAIEFKLDGTILVVEGVGKNIDATSKQESVVHHAFGILSYDVASQEYKFKSYILDGKSADAWFKVISENNFSWGFDVPNGKIRYTITIDGGKKTWNEIGEFSRDGNQWLKFFEMNLNKK